MGRLRPAGFIRASLLTPSRPATRLAAGAQVVKPTNEAVTMVNANPCARPEFIWRFYSCTKHTYISVMAATEAEARSFLPTDPCIFAARFKLDALDVLTYWNRPMNCVEVH